MNQPTNQPTPQMQLLQAIAEATAAQCALLDQILTILQGSSNLASSLTEVLSKLAAPAQSSSPAAAQRQPADDTNTYSTFTATEIIMGYNDEGQVTYKLIGQPWIKFGIRVWPEVLPTIGIDASQLKPGRNAIKPITVKALNGEKFPKKVLGPAAQQQQPADNESDDILF